MGFFYANRHYSQKQLSHFLYLAYAILTSTFSRWIPFSLVYETAKLFNSDRGYCLYSTRPAIRPVRALVMHLALSKLGNNDLLFSSWVGSMRHVLTQSLFPKTLAKVITQAGFDAKQIMTGIPTVLVVRA